ncbi:hypothetical protein HG531_007102 [Fusarium graminearum]|nr:hypothetical protein HG531_007102 [Fusarium graminearum]
MMLNLRQLKSLAVDLDLVVLSSLELDRSILGDFNKITGPVKPALTARGLTSELAAPSRVGDERLCILLRILEISLRKNWTLDEKFTNDADR